LQNLNPLAVIATRSTAQSWLFWSSFPGLVFISSSTQETVATNPKFKLQKLNTAFQMWSLPFFCKRNL